MAKPTDFEGTNFTFLAPESDKETVSDLRVFHNGKQIVSCWELSDAELLEIMKTKRVYITIMGAGMPPIYIGSESEVRAMVADNGVWKKGNGA